MAAPKANFYFENKTLLKIKCWDLSNQESTPPVTAWSWNFGDGNSATTQNPEHAFSAPGIYLVSLTVGSLDGSSIRSIYVSLDDDKFIVTLPIIELVRTKIPSALFDYMNIISLVQKWQLMLQPQINPVPIPDIAVYDETQWPSLANVLIAELVVYDILMNTINQMIAAGGGPPTGEMSSAQAGGIKSTEIGPSKTEWFNAKESSAIFFKAVLANSSQFIPEFQMRICTIAKRLLISLPFCKARNINFLFKKSPAPDPTFRFTEYYPALKNYEQAPLG